MVDYLKIVAAIKATLETQSTPLPAVPLESTAHGPVDQDTMRGIIEREMSLWTEERRQNLTDELKSIETYRSTRHPSPPGPSPGIDRSEAFAAIGAVMDRLGKIWPRDLEPDPHWQVKVWEVEQIGGWEAFLGLLKDWEVSETRRVEAHMDEIRQTGPLQAPVYSTGTGINESRPGFRNPGAAPLPRGSHPQSLP
ncbi:MAG TPA: hypothetical protein PK878_15455 [bacterium]|nr:hypothetical protein [bacterium]